MTLDQQFNILNEKLQRLLKQQERVQKENERLRAELQQAKEAEQQVKAELDTALQQVAILKYAAGELSERDKKEFEKKINQYIREIDRCIAHLSQ
jgi:seryl-tRNA synthetase